MNPTLTNLTPRQKLLADLIWACTTMEQAQTLVQSLQGQDRIDARAIIECLVLEVLEEQLEDYKDAATDCIARVMLR